MESKNIYSAYFQSAIFSAFLEMNFPNYYYPNLATSFHTQADQESSFAPLITIKNFSTITHLILLKPSIQTHGYYLLYSYKKII